MWTLFVNVMFLSCSAAAVPSDMSPKDKLEEMKEWYGMLEYFYGILQSSDRMEEVIAEATVTYGGDRVAFAEFVEMTNKDIWKRMVFAAYMGNVEWEDDKNREQHFKWHNEIHGLYRSWYDDPTDDAFVNRYEEGDAFSMGLALFFLDLPVYKVDAYDMVIDFAENHHLDWKSNWQCEFLKFTQTPEKKHSLYGGDIHTLLTDEHERSSFKAFSSLLGAVEKDNSGQVQRLVSEIGRDNIMAMRKPNLARFQELFTIISLYTQPRESHSQEKVEQGLRYAVDSSLTNVFALLLERGYHDREQLQDLAFLAAQLERNDILQMISNEVGIFSKDAIPLFYIAAGFRPNEEVLWLLFQEGFHPPTKSEIETFLRSEEAHKLLWFASKKKEYISKEVDRVYQNMYSAIQEFEQVMDRMDKDRKKDLN